MNFMTRHATTRCQQRGIPQAVLDLLFEHGQVRQMHNSEIYHFSKASLRRMKRLSRDEDLRTVEEHRKCYLVSCNGMVVTVGHRYKRLRSQ